MDKALVARPRPPDLDDVTVEASALAVVFGFHKMVPLKSFLLMRKAFPAGRLERNELRVEGEVGIGDRLAAEFELRVEPTLALGDVGAEFELRVETQALDDELTVELERVSTLCDEMAATFELRVLEADDTPLVVEFCLRAITIFTPDGRLSRRDALRASTLTHWAAPEAELELRVETVAVATLALVSVLW